MVLVVDDADDPKDGITGGGIPTAGNRLVVMKNFPPKQSENFGCGVACMNFPVEQTRFLSSPTLSVVKADGDDDKEEEAEDDADETPSLGLGST